MDASLNTYAEFLDTIPDAALLVDTTGRIQFANQYLSELFLRSPDSLIQQPVEVLIPSAHRAKHPEYVRDYWSHPTRRPMGSGMNLNAERADGKTFPVDIMLSPVELEGKAYVLCVVRDLTRQKLQESQLRNALEREKQLALTDPLTGAANIRRLRLALEQEIERCQRYGHPFALAYIDLDHFKALNDRFGHSEGDRVLQRITEVAQARLRASDIVARLGGDEFAVLLPETAHEDVQAVFSSLMALLNAAMSEGHWPVTFSCGVVSFDSAPPSSDQALKVADQLMYETKASGRNACRFSTYRNSATTECSES
ncbi:sensor domain-containing diguanylate cyclase [Marinobacteraceae bacterium S3BR75-40.1]